MATLWNSIRSLVDKNRASYVYARIPRDASDAADGDAPLTPQASYLRLWLCELYLGKSRAWGRDWFPAVHAGVRLKLADRDEATLSRVVRPPDGQLGEGVYLNHRLTELLPYNGGVVEIEAALLALPGASYLSAAIGVLQQFSSLVVPPLGTALVVAAKVSEGVTDLVDATQGGVHLGYHDSLVSGGGGGGNLLQPGYLAVVLATAEQVDAGRLSVTGDRLRYASRPGDPAGPLVGHDYLLLRVEGRTDRDDWRMLSNIDEAMQQAVVALSQGDEERARAHRAAALAAAWQSPDLALHDRRRVVVAIKEELAAVQSEGFGAVGGAVRSLDDVMSSRAMPLAQATALGELTAEEVFGEAR